MSAANTTFATVMRGVAEALELDGDNRVQEAYMKYLECVLRICTKLLQDARHGGNMHSIINKETVKMVRLAQQCMERLSTSVNQIGSQSSPGDGSQLKMSTKPSPGDSSQLKMSAKASPGDSLQLKMTPKPTRTKSEPCTPSEQYTKSSLFTHSLTIPKEQSPLEQAYKQNHLLMMAYKARLARLDPKRRIATSLTVQRKMAENLAIAKVQEEALKKKMNERQQRLEEQAARRFGTPTGLTDDDKEQRQIYKKVLEFEQESDEFSKMRKDLEERPNSPELINKLIQMITRSPDHPLTQKMKTQQNRIYNKLRHLVEQKMNILDQIKVPLSKTLYPKHHFESCKLEEAVKEESIEADNEEVSKQDEAEDTSISESESKTIEVTNEINDGDEHSKEIMEEQDDIEDDEQRGDTWEPKFTANDDDIVETSDKVQIELKDNLEKAIDMGDKECKKIRENLKETRGILHQISQEYDSYNQDNMDELFEDEENSDEELTKDNLHDDDKLENKGQKVRDETVIKPSASLSDLKLIEMKIKDLKNEAYHRHIKAVSEDIHLYLEKMLVLFTVCYEQLDCIEGKDQCYACLEESIFKPIWIYLLGLFRLANEPKELSLAYVMTERMTCTPEDCYVKGKLQMTDCDTPYDTVVTHLKTLPHQETLLSKLECIVKCSRLVCQCIEDYYRNQKIPTIGADDLLPILCYVIVKTGQPQILSECLILEEFIHEGYIMGEEGYCLTSIQTAIGYLISQGMAS